MQDYKKSEAKQRLFGDVRAGKVRFLIGSSETMGTGVNAQLRLKALHHLDVPWLPSQIEQREGRIVRQGNQHDEVDIFAYATEGSLDAQMWQNNERKARFIAAALSGDTSVRRLEDLGEGQANQFAMAKAIASGDQRLMQKAGLEADIARLERLRAAHIDDQHAVRRQIRDAERDIESATAADRRDRPGYRAPGSDCGDAFAMTVAGQILHRAQGGRPRADEGDPDPGAAPAGGRERHRLDRRLRSRIFRRALRQGRLSLHHHADAHRRRDEIELPVTVTPLGAISRLEHRSPISRASRSAIASVSPMPSAGSPPIVARGPSSPSPAKLADKRRQLAEIEAICGRMSTASAEPLQDAA
jgi:hypothetical protein